MNPNANLILNRNVYWKVRELVENQYSWTFKTNYDVLSAYPHTANAVIVYPSICIATGVINTIPFELGARDRYNFFTEIVILSNSIAQRDALTFYLLDNFHNRDYRLYNMENSNPVGVGDYSNLTSFGIYRCMDAYSSYIPVPVELDDKKMRYESDISVNIECPNF